MFFSRLSSGYLKNWILLAFLNIQDICAQITPQEWTPLIDGLSNPPIDIAERVPLMTNDTVKIPLVDLQIFAPPSNGGRTRTTSNSCTVKLLEHSFGINSFNVPAIVGYTPPSSVECGDIGNWAGISLNLTVHWSG